MMGPVRSTSRQRETVQNARSCCGPVVADEFAESIAALDLAGDRWTGVWGAQMRVGAENAITVSAGGVRDRVPGFATRGAIAGR